MNKKYYSALIVVVIILFLIPVVNYKINQKRQVDQQKKSNQTAIVPENRISEYCKNRKIEQKVLSKEEEKKIEDKVTKALNPADCDKFRQQKNIPAQVSEIDNKSLSIKFKDKPEQKFVLQDDTYYFAVFVDNGWQDISRQEITKDDICPNDDILINAFILEDSPDYYARVVKLIIKKDQ